MKKLVRLGIVLAGMLILFTSCFDDSSSDDPAVSYNVSFSVNGVAKVFTGGMTERYSGALSSYDTSSPPQTSIYAYPAAITGGVYTDGIRIVHFEGNSTGTDTSCDIVYKENGTDYTAINTTVNITAYGATGSAVTGTVTNCLATAAGGGTKTLTDITFNVYNSGPE